jgi:hypothetical protein
LPALPFGRLLASMRNALFIDGVGHDRGCTTGGRRILEWTIVAGLHDMSGPVTAACLHVAKSA